MHSPDPDSGSSSPATDSPPPEENFPTSSSTTSGFFNLASQLTSSFSGSPSKRRLPGSSFPTGSSSRDPKSRRRDDPRRGTWDGKEGGKREKEELVDNHVVETLRKEIGDPFNETAFKAAS
ncbi:hypothetical protein R3P38DRAFT_2830774 [Favolaschia claudopus]|uniref:Uncharacterized protein n=1 Tax=Favolaschia claudopus TaxID=2862362 RepID=A0AAW0EBS9_9AGAR